MNWDAIGAVAQVMGLIAVVVSLIYIAIQTKQTNEHATASSEIEWLTSWNDVISSWANDRETAITIQAGFASFESLDNADKAFFAQRIAALINQWVLAQQLSEKRLLSRTVADGATKVVVAVLMTKGGFEYLEASWRYFPRGDQLLDLVKEADGREPSFSDAQPWWQTSA